MALPALVASGDVIAATHINAIRNSLATWSYTVDAQNNELRNVGAFSAASGVFSGNISGAAISGTSLSTSGALAAASATITGGLSAGAINSSGVLTVSNQAIFTGALSASGLTVSGAVSAASVAATGAVTGATATFTGNVTAANFVYSGALGGQSASFTGALTCSGITNSGIFLWAGSDLRYWECESPHVAFYKKSGAFNYYWRRSDTGHTGGGHEVEMMSLDDGGNLAVLGNASGTQIHLSSTGTADIGYRLTDAVRAWKMGINLGGTGSGKFSIYNLSAGHAVLVAGDSDLYLDVTGTGLRRLTIDSNNFLKVI